MASSDCHDLFRGTKLVFHPLAAGNLYDSLDDDPAARTDSVLDHIDVLDFVPADDSALMRHVVFADDVNIPPMARSPGVGCESNGQVHVG